MQITTSTNAGIWGTVPCTITPMADRDVYTYYYEGTFDRVCDECANYVVGMQFSLPEAYRSGIYQDAQIVTGLSVQRKRGGLADFQLQITCLYKREIWNIDFAEVSKDIKTWLVQKYIDENLGEVEAYKELRKIAQWENMRENDNWEDWGNFRYYDDVSKQTKELTGDTLTLAQKIMKGVTNYTIYAPVITRTTIQAIAPQVGTIGKRNAPATVNGWSGFNNQPLPAYWVQLAKDWLKTAEKSNSNQDGTFSLTEQWKGGDMVDGDLYPNANAPAA